MLLLAPAKAVLADTSTFLPLPPSACQARLLVLCPPARAALQHLLLLLAEALSTAAVPLLRASSEAHALALLAAACRRIMLPPWLLVSKQAEVLQLGLLHGLQLQKR
jgi:hypothetical protein